ncbi:unnamed protein product, partial [Amoebophrya sp. A120]|eukprot:GSA120T00010079001.1
MGCLHGVIKFCCRTRKCSISLFQLIVQMQVPRRSVSLTQQRSSVSFFFQRLVLSLP